jgi:hypothetical protein
MSLQLASAVVGLVLAWAGTPFCHKIKKFRDIGLGENGGAKTDHGSGGMSPLRAA